MSRDSKVTITQKGAEDSPVGQLPTLQSLQQFASDWLNGAGVAIISESLLCVTLSGIASDPLRTLKPAHSKQAVYDEKPMREFEISIAADSCLEVWVTTRTQDPFTNAVAQRLAEHVALMWGGTCKHPT